MTYTWQKAEANGFLHEPQNILSVIILMMRAKVLPVPLQHLIFVFPNRFILVRVVSITAQLMKYDQSLVSFTAWTLVWAQCPQCWNLVLVNSNQRNREVSWDLVKCPYGLPVDSVSDITASSHGSRSDCSCAGWEVFVNPLQYLSVNKQEHSDLDLFLSSVCKKKTINQYMFLKWHLNPRPHPPGALPWWCSPVSVFIRLCLWLWNEVKMSWPRYGHRWEVYYKGL